MSTLDTFAARAATPPPERPHPPLAALALVDQPHVRCRLALALAEILAAAGERSAALAVVADGLDAARATADVPVEALETLAAALRAGDPAAVADLDRDHARLDALAAGDGPGARRLAALLAGVAGARGQADAALALADRALAAGPACLATDLATGGVLSALAAAGADARAAQVGQVIAVAAESRSAELVARAHLGLGRARRGDLPGAEAQLRGVLTAAARERLAGPWSMALAFLEDVMVERPGAHDLVAMVEAADTAAPAIGPPAEPTLREVRARVRLATGDAGGALDDLRAAAARNAALGHAPAHSPWRSQLALALPGSERDRARALAADELARARTTRVARPVGIALRAAGLLATGAARRYQLAASVTVLAPSGARLEHARSLVALGTALHGDGDRRAAQAALADGMERAHACGAERLVEQALDALRATGSRPRRVARTGVGALTASERRVVTLARDGHTNAEIAQQLFVTLKTVETHLSHAYAKLGITGAGARARLAAALAPAAGTP
jgi:DNA-binding CsgD family transcriptional regulator